MRTELVPKTHSAWRRLRRYGEPLYVLRMTPPAPIKERKFTFLLTDEDRSMLEALASDERRTASDWLRLTIVDSYRAKFGNKAPKKPRPQK